MPNIGSGNISKVRFAEQGADVGAPAATFSVLYLLASGVLRVRNAAATVYQYVTTAHDHSGTTNGPKVTQANSHESPDTDAAVGSLHHTIGATATTAAAGNHAHAGSAITNTPAGGIASTDVQAAINELDTEKAPIASPTFTGITTAPEFSASGLTGAVAASRYVGATASGAPVAGTFAIGDFVIDQTGKVWVCTTAGTPGTWAQVGVAAAAYVYSQIVFSIEGVNLSATGVKPLRVYAPLLGGATATILGVRVAVNSSPGATALRMDVHKDGSTILNTTAYVEVGVGAYTTERTTDFVAPGTFVAGAYFQIEVVQGDATAADCTVAIEFKYQAPGS